MTAEDGENPPIEILLAGISHDLKRNVSSVSSHVEGWVRKFGPEFGASFRGELAEVRKIAADCDVLADRLTALVNRADRHEFRDVREMVHTFEQEVGYPLFRAANRLKRIDFGRRTSATAVAFDQLLSLAKGYERAGQLLNSLSKFAVIRMRPSYKTANLSKLLKVITYDLGGLFIQEHLMLSQVHQIGAATVRSDRALISTIVSNLLSNAIVHRSPRRRLEITIKIYGVPLERILNLGGATVGLHGPRNWACIEISDNGLGISSDDREKVFQLFKQGSRAARSGRGSGVGLALVRYSLQLLGGCVQLRSTLGIGSTFRVFLPDGPPEGRIEALVGTEEY